MADGAATADVGGTKEGGDGDLDNEFAVEEGAIFGNSSSCTDVSGGFSGWGDGIAKVDGNVVNGRDGEGAVASFSRTGVTLFGFGVGVTVAEEEIEEEEEEEEEEGEGTSASISCTGVPLFG